MAGTALGVAMAALVGAVVNGYLSQQGLEGVRLAVPAAIVLTGIGGAALLALVAGNDAARRAARLSA